MEKFDQSMKEMFVNECKHVALSDHQKDELRQAMLRELGEARESMWRRLVARMSMF